MRSLYTDDIAGTRSKITVFQKSIFKEKYDRFARSNQKNPQHKKYQWYVPPKKQRNESLDNKQQRFTLKLMSQHTGLSRSGHFQQYKKVDIQNFQSKKKSNNSILNHSASQSINQSSQKKGLDNNPYFPHRYQDYNESRIKWSGKRNWDYDRPQKLQLPRITKSRLISHI